MSTQSRRQRILEAYRTRVQAIRRANGYQTDAGLSVVVGETPALGPDDPLEVIAIVPGDEEPERTGENVYTRDWPVEIQALSHATGDGDIGDAWMVVEAIIADIKRAIELEDRTLGGLVKSRIERGLVQALEREEGSLTVGCRVVYRGALVEQWGDP